MNKPLTLKSLKFSEHLGERKNWEIQQLDLQEFNLITGDNAQGKTRLVNVIKFLKNIHLRNIQIQNPLLRLLAELRFDDDGEEIFYQIEIKSDPNTKKMSIFDKIQRGDLVLVDRNTRQMYDENTKKSIESFFIPENIPAVVALNDQRFPTLEKIRDFFIGTLFFDGQRFNHHNIEVTPNLSILKENGANLSSVVPMLKDKNPQVYKELINEFEDCFPFIVKGSLSSQELPVPEAKVKAPMLTLSEKNIQNTIPQLEWSDSLLRALCLFLLPLQPVPSPNGEILPQFICIDDFDIGLDYNTLTQVLSFFKERYKLQQYLLISRNQLTCSMVEAEHWRVARRRGTSVSFSTPSLSPELEETRKRIVKENFEFYRQNLSRNKFFSVN